MRNFKDIILEKLKVPKTAYTTSFTFDELYESIVRFAKRNMPSNNTVLKDGAYYTVNFGRLDYFKDNPLIITNGTALRKIYILDGCKVGKFILNTNNPDYIICWTINRNVTLNDRKTTDVEFKLTSENFDKGFNIEDLENLYKFFNEEN